VIGGDCGTDGDYPVRGVGKWNAWKAKIIGINKMR
jgi:hypothetical protein